MKLDDKVVIATGAGSGIGAAVAEACAGYGAKVVGLECNRQTLDETARRVAVKHGSFLPVYADVTSEQSVAKAFQTITAEYGNIDVLVNNVGVEFYKDFADIHTPEWDQQINVNLRSVFLCCSHVVPQMIQARKGSNQHSIRAGIRYNRANGPICGGKGRCPWAHPRYGDRPWPAQYSSQRHLPGMYRYSDDGPITQSEHGP
jgi:NAD(P)-dependent dehydrogenase (short-subunit alcohol dehydrogenase family)